MKWKKKSGKWRASVMECECTVVADGDGFKASYRNAAGAWTSEKFSNVEDAKFWCAEQANPPRYAARRGHRRPRRSAGCGRNSGRVR